MKIAYIYDAVYPWVKGGAEKRIYEIGKRLSDKGHEVHWLCYKVVDDNSVIEKGVFLRSVREAEGIIC